MVGTNTGTSNLNKTKASAGLLNLVMDPSYILNIFLPIIAALLKREQNFKYMGMEMLFYIVKLVKENEITSIKNLTYYSYIDVLKDIISFIYNNHEPESKRKFVIQGYLELVKLFSDECKKSLYLNLLSQSEQDHEIALIFDLIKQNINYEVKRGNFNSQIFETKFLKKVITSTLTDEIFPIDALETLGQACNFLINLILVDKQHFDCKLGICEKEFLEEVRVKTIQPLEKIIGKWERGSDDEKRKYIKEHEHQIYMITKEAKKNVEKVDQHFNLRKNQANF